MEIPKISEAEWQVMYILWTESPLTANQIIDRLKENTDWKPKTVKTLINRLLNKNAIDYSQNGREYSYYPLVSKDECIKSENQNFLERVYGGALHTMLLNFIEKHEMSQEEIDELKKLLDNKQNPAH